MIRGTGASDVESTAIANYYNSSMIVFDFAVDVRFLYEYNQENIRRTTIVNNNK